MNGQIRESLFSFSRSCEAAQQELSTTRTKIHPQGDIFRAGDCHRLIRNDKTSPKYRFLFSEQNEHCGV